MEESARTVLEEIAQAQHGVLSTVDARAEGVNPDVLRALWRRGVFERLSRGVFRLTSAPREKLTPYMAACLWPQGSRGVISHISALALHELCDVSPTKIDLTLPRSYRARRRDVPALYVVHRRDLEPDDETYMDGVPIVTPVRAIFDGIEVDLRTSLIEQAIQSLRARHNLGIRTETQIFDALSRRERGAGR